MNELNIILNGKTITANPDQTILQLAEENGITIPTLCHDPRLEPFSSCYVCVVEIDGCRGLQPACSTKITEGMTVVTDNDKIRKARKMALDLLASTHFADCVAPCRQTCPAGVDVQGYISLIEKGLFAEAVALIREVNPLPAICGRVCVRPCEVACRRNLLDEGSGVGIDYLKRFASDHELSMEHRRLPEIAAPTGKKIAIIGAGPGGLSAAWFLQLKGHQCDIFEANPHAGGWLRYGIPEYRLPNDILDEEIDFITATGVNIFYNRRLGADLSYREIGNNYDSMILTIGSQRGSLLGCPGEDADGVFSGIDFLKNMEMTGQRYDFRGKKVAVVGGGNTAMDCSRTSVRCGADKVYILYRRTEKEMPANPIEIHESQIEGVEYMFLTNPVRVNRNGQGAVNSVTCVRMELGEPDASGRRRPVPVDGSEFDIEIDYILAAIGQQTEVDFLEDVNNNASEGKLEVNKWGDISADRGTLQTGIANVFAAGDGVSGPATIIEAVAQAGIAARSCHQYLSGLTPEPLKQEFMSRKENFMQPSSGILTERYQHQLRQEMPVLDAKSRNNFDEVELGYDNKEMAVKETARCLECGCSELYSCDFRDLSVEYSARQNKFKGSFRVYETDHSHPYIQIDNNKCILCARCVRICREVVGAAALGLVNRGFETFVAPSLGDSLTETDCESCGLCISTCPTGAITENILFKPLPIKGDVVKTICNYCSVGCGINIHHKEQFVYRVTGNRGLINTDGNICRYARFGYRYLNDSSRITKPLLKKEGNFVEISFKEAFEIIHSRVKSVSQGENAFYGGARLTNEELHLIGELSRNCSGKAHVSSFHYLGGEGYKYNSVTAVPAAQISEATRIYLIGSEINADNAVIGFMISNLKQTRGVPVEVITTHDISSMEHKAGKTWRIKSYYHFVKALNYFYLSEGLASDAGAALKGFDEYRDALLKEDHDALIEASGFCSRESLREFAVRLSNESNPMLVYSEKEVSPNTSLELINLSILAGKAGKAAGIVALKEKNNSAGILEMGIDDNHISLLQSGSIRNMFIFGEDPVGCATDREMVAEWLNNAGFIMVQDYFMTETAAMADLILPASFPIESGGSYINTGGVLQQFEKHFKPAVELTGAEQLIALLKAFGYDEYNSQGEVTRDVLALLSPEGGKQVQSVMVTRDEDQYRRLFNHGCDYIVRMFDNQFALAFHNGTKT
jgi:formate dehydrogenase major subunit